MEEKKETKENVKDQTDKKVEEKKERKVYKRSEGSRRPQKKRYSNRKKFFFKKRVCLFCTKRDAVIDYKDVGLMRRFVSDSGKISPRRFTGTCAKHQKKVSVEIKKARQMALLTFTDKHK